MRGRSGELTPSSECPSWIEKNGAHFHYDSLREDVTKILLFGFPAEDMDSKVSTVYQGPTSIHLPPRFGW